MSQMVQEAISILGGNRDMNSFGKLLHEAWMAKRSLSKIVSNSHIDEIYDAAIDAGAIGGKLAGAGGGGFLTLFVSPENQKQVRKKLHKLIYVPIKFDFSGSQIIFFDPQKDQLDDIYDLGNVSPQAFRELRDMR